MRLRFPIAFTFLFAACSSPGAGTASVSGTIQGTAFDAHDAISLTLDKSDGHSTAVYITTFAQACDESPNVLSQSGTIIALGLVVPGTSPSSIAAPTAPGTFPITTSSEAPNAPAADAVIIENGTNIEATSGSVTLSTVNSSGLIGRFDLTLENGDHLTGQFNTATCAPGDGGSTRDGGNGGDAGTK